jgi:hypothetical protein
MLRAEPKSWFSWDFFVMDGDRELTLIDLACFREAGTFAVNGTHYQMRREGYLRGAFTLERDGTVIARAVKPSALKRLFDIEHGAARYTLKAKSSFGRTFLLLDGEHTAGELRPDHALTRKATIDLPASIPVPMQIFITLLMIILWKREAEAAAAA